ncbi:lantibiotic immunity ABC transporter MutG family permease subunit [Paenibacillus wulumuqiensis]|uniref:lantibiotic immunity ABC transporter MutG family permease subunit n=1 Tax=Paenibacillus wulumuqiensis TaxID=1567107 RepID=UPI00069873FA|nr:lantibiotic immunity ABC transporter MutG family permease subunit [Paenibacillus wulumuqiensis]
MAALWRCLYADYYKSRHTPFLWMHIGLPLVWAIVYLLYVHGRSPVLVSLYTGYMEILGVAMPLVSGIICGMVSMQEEQAGQFQNMLVSSPVKETAYLSKLLFVWGSGSLAILLAAVLLGVGATFVLRMERLPYDTFLWGAVYLSVSSVIFYIIHLWAGFTFGIGACMIIGGVGTLVAALMITSVGDAVWHYIPWGWGVRMVDSTALLRLGTLTGEMRTYVEGDVQIGWLWIILSTAVIGIMSLIWFHSWQGSRHAE